MIKDYPLLSIIIPVYNTENYLRKCLDSCFSQTYKNIEIIVVNDGSKGNVEDIIKDYSAVHDNILLCGGAINQGVFKSRILGVENSKGEFIAFLDSDDYVGVDYYRKMIFHALKTNSDMVAADFLVNDEESCKLSYFNYSNLRIKDYNLSGEEIARHFFKQEGLDYSWYVIWNKIYSRELWNKCYPYLKEIDENFRVCADVPFSLMFFLFAQRFTNTHNDYYFYTNNKNSLTHKFSENTFKGKIESVVKVFKYCYDLTAELTQNDIYLNQLNSFKLLILKLWKRNLNQLKVNAATENTLMSMITSANEGNVVEDVSEDDEFFYRLSTNVKAVSFESLKKSIVNNSVISFDIFDTLITRPFLTPTDLFYFLNEFASEILQSNKTINFNEIRINAEEFARANKKNSNITDITLDEIYTQIRNDTDIPSEILSQLKQREIELELAYCVRRQSAFELYELAVYLGKKLIFISDMYLPISAIKEILNKNDYYADEIYVSNEQILTKASGKLFKKLKQDLNNETWLHIGDNIHSDYLMPRKYKINAIHFPSAFEIFFNLSPNIYGGRIISKILKFKPNLITSNKLCMNCMLAMIANKIFDNPFVNLNRNTDFNSDPYFIGYFIFGMAKFSNNINEQRQYNKVINDNKEILLSILCESNFNYQAYFILNTLQNAAVDFIIDIVNVFGQDLLKLNFQNLYTCAPLEWFLNNSLLTDRNMFFSIYSVENAKTRILEIWNQQSKVSQGFRQSLLHDRQQLKNSVKLKFQKHPIFFKIFVRFPYKVVKKIFKLFSRKKR